MEGERVTKNPKKVEVGKEEILAGTSTGSNPGTTAKYVWH